MYPSGLWSQGMRKIIRNKPNITLMATLYYLFLSFYATDRIVKKFVTVVSFWEEKCDALLLLSIHKQIANRLAQEVVQDRIRKGIGNGEHF